MVEVVVADAANNGAEVGQAGEARQMLADLHAGDRRGDGAEGAADLFRGVRLGVPGVKLALAAAGEDDEDRFRLAEAWKRPSRGRLAPGPGEKAETRQAADAQPFAAGQDAPVNDDRRKSAARRPLGMDLSRIAGRGEDRQGRTSRPQFMTDGGSRSAICSRRPTGVRDHWIVRRSIRHNALRVAPMSDKLVEVAAYSLPVEAHAARGLLEAEGIRAVVEGEGSGRRILGRSRHRREGHLARRGIRRGAGGGLAFRDRRWAAAGRLRPVALPAMRRRRQHRRAGLSGVRDAPAGNLASASAMGAAPFNPESEDIQTEAPRNRNTITSDTHPGGRVVGSALIFAPEPHDTAWGACRT